MIGVICAAGEGKRLGLGCKALVNVNRTPLISYALNNMRLTGIKEVIIIQDEKRLIENKLGKEAYKIKLKYIIQKEKWGIAHAVSLTEKLTHGNDIMLMFADIYFKGTLLKMKNYFEGSEYDSLVAGQTCLDEDKIKKSYGITEDMKFVEKPVDCVDLQPMLGLGIYFFKNKVYDAIRTTPINKVTGEIEITDVLNYMIASFYPVEGKYFNVNTKEDLKHLKNEVKLNR